MVTVPLIAISIYIVLRDLREHIISNRSLVVLGICLAAMHNQPSFAISLIATTILLSLIFMSEIGGGDIKLLLILIWSASHLFFTTRYLSIFLVIALFHLIYVGRQAGWRRTHIPLAPAILLPIVALHLGI